MKAIESKNKQHGFYGTTILNGKHKIENEWPAAFEWVYKAIPVWKPTMIRDFLDSKWGRHLADEATSFRSVSDVNPARWIDTFCVFATDCGQEKEIAGIKMQYLAEKQFRAARERLQQVRLKLESALKYLPVGKPMSDFQEKQKAEIESKLELICGFLEE